MLLSMSLNTEGKHTVMPISGSKSSIQTDHYEGQQNAEATLYNRLLSSYNRRLRPVLNTQDAVQVNVSITLANVLELNEKQQSLTMLLQILTKWFDPLLAWNETEFPGTHLLVLQKDEIWTHDLIVNNALGNTIPIAEGILGKPEGVKVFPSGLVRYWFPVVLTSFCPMNIELFPFDIQTCPIDISSYTYDSAQLQLSPLGGVAKLKQTNYKSDVSKSWIIKNFTGRKGVHKGIDGGNLRYDHMDFTITLKRKSTFYVLNLLLPCYLISIIACLCYAIPPQGGDRINLLLTTFLAIVVFVLVVLEIVPEESDTLPLFSQFLLEVIYCKSRNTGLQEKLANLGLGQN